MPEQKVDKTQSNRKNKFLHFLTSIPFFLRITISYSILNFFLFFFFQSISGLLINNSSKTLLQLQFWRLFSSPFITTNLIGLTFILYVWISDAKELERNNGSTRYFINFAVNSFFIQLIFVLLFTPVAWFFPNFDELNCSGIIPTIFCEISILCLANPNSRYSFAFTTFTIRNKYLPYLIALILGVLQMAYLLADIAASLLYAFIFYYFLRRYLILHDPFITQVEAFWPLNWLKTKHSYVSLENCLELSMAKSVGQRSQSDNEIEQDKSKFGKILNSFPTESQ